MSEPPSPSVASLSGGGSKREFAKKLHSGSELRAQGSAAARLQMQERENESASPDVAVPHDLPPLTRQPLEKPVNYEELLNDKKKVIHKDPLKDILVFPENAIAIETLARDYRTVRSSCPRQGTDKSMPRMAQKLFDIYTDDWFVVRRSLMNLSHYPPPALVGDAKAHPVNGDGEAAKYLVVPEHKFEIDMQKSDQSKNVKSVFSDAKELSANDADERIEFYKSSKPDRNMEETKNMLRLFQINDDRLDSVEIQQRSFGQPPKESFGKRVMIECEELKMGETPEPFFGILSLYDIKSKKKLSENFHFDTNSDDVFNLLQRHMPDSKDFASVSRQALFQINFPSRDLYLIVRVEKVLEGGLDDAFSRASAFKGKKDTIIDFCSRLGKFRQPYAWAAIPLFGEDMNIEIAGQDIKEKCTIQTFYKYDEKIEPDDESILSSITSAKKTKSTVAGTLTFRISQIEPHEQPPNCFTPQLVAVKPFSSATEKDIKLIKEIEEFPSIPVSHPYNDYVNTLYVYPISVNFSKVSAVSKGNIAIKVQFVPSSSVSQPGQNAMKAIYGKSSSKNFVSELYTSVNFHNTKPTLYDEIKIAIPVNLSKFHHILFTFYHISCKPKAKRKGDGETLVGYSWLPIYENGKIIKTNKNTLPVYHELEKNYDGPNANNKAIDSKGVTSFVVETRVVSTIFTTDERINRVFALLQETPAEDELIKVLADLENAEKSELVHFCYVLFDELFALFTRNTVSSNLGQNLIRCIARIVATYYDETNKTETDSRRESLIAYINFRFSNPKATPKYVFEELSQAFVNAVTSTDKNAEKDIRNLQRYSWFFFDIIMKSVHQYLHEKEKWNASMVPNPKWFQPSFFKCAKDSSNKEVLSGSIDRIINECCQQVIRLSDAGLTIGQELNQSVAFLITDLAYFIERVHIFTWIKKYVESLGYDNETLNGFKFEFLKIVCGYELYVPLNLPTMDTQERPFNQLGNCLSEFSRRSYLSSLLLHQIQQYLDNNGSKESKSKVVSVLRDVLLKHDVDPRYDSKEKKARIVGLYFPFLLTVISKAPSLAEDSQAFTREQRRAIFMCFLFILQNMDSKWMLEWLRKEMAENFGYFLDILNYSLQTFQYRGRTEIQKKRADSISVSTAAETKRTLEGMYGNRGTATTNAKSSASISSGPSGRRFVTKTSGDGTSSLSHYHNSISAAGVPVRDEGLDIKLGGALAVDTCMVVLDVFEKILLYQNPKSGDTEQSKKMFGLLIAFLDQPQSEKVLINLFGTIKAFILKFPQAIYKEGNRYCSEICRVVLRHGTSSLMSVRQHVAALLYLMLKKNYEGSNNDSCLKVRIQIIVALSKLELKEDVFLRKCFASVLLYAKEDATMSNTTLPIQVKDLIDTLFTIARDLIKIRDCEDDIEMVADMHYRIAKGYMNSPELRIATLDTLSREHFKNQNFAEAAYCHIHTAALISQCVFLLQRKGKNTDENVAPGASAFTYISQNLSEEMETSIEGDGVTDSEEFKSGTVIENLRKSIHILQKASLFETINDVGKLIIPYWEKQRNYEQLGTFHYDLSQYFNQIKELNLSGKRMLGTYYRIGFYGSLFGDLDGQEFIYREKKITPLAEVSNRMEAFYVKKFGADKFSILHDSSDVDVKKLPSDKAHLQITFVEPYFTEEELRYRVTYFDRNNHINRFVFETPFTKSGKARGSTEDQYLRKTYLTTDHYFPYVKRRLNVIRREHEELNPIQVAIESISKRCQSLRQAIEANIAKSLQVVLQGSVRLQVNAGPIELAKCFLEGDKPKKWDERDVERLKDLFVDFLGYCKSAINLNESHVKYDQRAYQDDLKEGYNDLKQKLVGLLNDPHLESKLNNVALPTPNAVGDKDVFGAISGPSADSATPQT